MRLRRQPEVKEKLKQYANLLVSDPSFYKGNWRQRMAPCGKLVLEIGMGRGVFINTLAALHPEHNYIGLDFREEMVYEGIAFLQGKEPQNLRFLWQLAQNLPAMFAPSELDRIHLNFPDPWPKKRHAKRRLVHKNFLAIYRQILAPQGDLWLKTDQADLFTFALEEFLADGWQIAAATENLCQSGWKNMETEYEKRYIKQNKPIYCCRVWLPAAKAQAISGKQEVSLCDI